MRAILRFLGFLAVVGGFVALVIDATRYIANDVWTPLTLLDALNATASDAGARLVASATSLAGATAGHVVASALTAPTSAAGLIGGFVLMFLFRRRSADDTP